MKCGYIWVFCYWGIIEASAASGIEPRIFVVRKVVPPKKNPYPASNQDEMNRVAFAQTAIDLFFHREFDLQRLNKYLFISGYRSLSEDAKRSKPHVNKSLGCLQNQQCWEKDLPFADFVAGRQSMRYAFKNPKVQWCHTVPWSMDSSTLKASQPPDTFAMQRKQELAYRHTTEPQAFVISPITLAKDEYLIDCVVQFEERDDWQHIFFVMAEARTRMLYLRRIEIQPIQDITRPTLFH